MSSKPNCKTGTRRCKINKLCFKPSTRKRTTRCNTGSRKCYNQKCYKIQKSRKSRNQFYNKYGTTKYLNTKSKPYKPFFY